MAVDIPDTIFHIRCTYWFHWCYRRNEFFGRATKSGPVDAFGYACETKNKRKLGEAIGFIPVLGALAMAIGYTVVMGWILKYMIGLLQERLLLHLLTQKALLLHLEVWQAHLVIMYGRL